MSATRGDLRGALRRAGVEDDQIPRVATAVEGIVSKAEDDVLRELAAFLTIRQCPAAAPGSPQCQKDEGHPGSHACIGLDWEPHTFEEFLQGRYEKALRRSREGRTPSDIVGEMVWPQDAAESHTAANRAADAALGLLASASGRTYGHRSLGDGRYAFGFETGEITVGPGERIVRYEDGTVLALSA